MINTTRPAIAALALALGCTATMAQTLPAPTPTKVYGAGDILIGLDGVTVLGQKYDVRFVGGQTCEQTFNGCDAASDFNFHTVDDANAASNAMLAALKLADFKTPSTTTQFNIFTPYSNSLAPWISTSRVTAAASGNSVANAYIFRTNTVLSNQAYATWTPSVSAVPEPGTYALMLAGLGTVGFVARRHRSR